MGESPDDIPVSPNRDKIKHWPLQQTLGFVPIPFSEITTQIRWNENDSSISHSLLSSTPAEAIPLSLEWVSSPSPWFTSTFLEDLLLPENHVADILPPHALCQLSFYRRGNWRTEKELLIAQGTHGIPGTRSFQCIIGLLYSTGVTSRKKSKLILKVLLKIVT
jgi:hypothetical protein